MANSLQANAKALKEKVKQQKENITRSMEFLVEKMQHARATGSTEAVDSIKREFDKLSKKKDEL